MTYERRWWTLGVLCLSLVLVVLDNSILNVALPTVQRDLDASTSQLQWIVDGYVLVFAGLLLTCGALGDRFGRKGALIIALALVGGRLAVPTSKDPGAPPLDPVGALLSIAGLTALLWAIIEAPSHGWTSGNTLVAFALAAGGSLHSWRGRCARLIRCSTWASSATPASPPRARP